MTRSLHRRPRSSHPAGRAGATSLALLLLSGCLVGPKYVAPAPPPPPPAFKEIPPNWTQASPLDQVPKGKWWEIYQDPQLNALEEKIAVSNQNLQAAYKQYMATRDVVQQARASLFPTVSAQATGARDKLSLDRPTATALTKNQYSDIAVEGNVSYEIDLWGQVRRTLENARETSQASAGDLQNINLSLQAQLATDYFSLRGLDLQKQLLDATVTDYQKALDLTQIRFKGGVSSDLDVAQAQTQLDDARSQQIDTGVQRAQLEHALAVLTGQTASTFSVPPTPLAGLPPAIPPGLPSELLERRPDIAAAERRVAAANAQIGIAMAAYYPQLGLSGAGGFESDAIGTVLNGSSILWNAAGNALETLFDAGRRRAVTQQARDTYDVSVANYRENVLEAIQQVEDNLAALRILEQEASSTDEAVTSAKRSVDLSTRRYKGGTANYLEVLTAQSTALTDERTAADLRTRRMLASVQLVKALGGGWDRSQLPKP